MTKSKSILMMDVMVGANKELEGRIKALEATERNVLAELRAQEITLGIVSKRVVELSKALSETVENQTGILLSIGDLIDKLNHHISRPYCHKEV